MADIKTLNAKNIDLDLSNVDDGYDTDIAVEAIFKQRMSVVDDEEFKYYENGNPVFRSYRRTELLEPLALIDITGRPDHGVPDKMTIDTSIDFESVVIKITETQDYHVDLIGIRTILMLEAEVTS